MNIYAVIATTQSAVPEIGSAVARSYAGEHIRVGDSGCWFVADSEVTSAQQVWTKMGEADAEGKRKELTNVIVLLAVLYWGNTDPTIWAWIRGKTQTKPSAT